MAYDYSELVEKTKRWAEQALSAGWINTETAQTLSDFDARTPEALFNHSGSRPLIVAFMGGTGVGKSSLLNRLAGKAIAKAGIERPTSREATLFHHKDITIQHLPEKLPIEKIRIAQHEDESKKNIVWIDMPDFDSTEQSNKALVFEWLPHIDVLIYVVSPERYRDEKAWRLLMSEGNRHAWLFVLNQWDRGQQAQYEDFKQQLGKAGFVEPIIFKTVCGESAYPDEFDALQATILSLSNKHVVAELEQRGTQVRKDELRQKLQNSQQKLGSHSTFKKAETLWEAQWQTTSDQLQQGFVWPIQKLAAYYADHAADLIGNPANSGSQADQVANALWDDWAQARFGDALDEFVVKVDELGLPVAPLKNQLAVVRTKAPKIVQAQSELHVRQALVRPGNVVHRAFLKFIRFCEIILPLSAIAWVGYQVFVGYYDSIATHDHYLGMDFAIHSSLLILISWLIPWFILKKLKPSLEKSALRGLNKGLENAINMIDGEVLNIVETVTQQHTAQLKKITEITEQCSAGEGYKSEKTGSDNPLTRMLIN
ncbi:MAG: 50S ribosome-binding GTPase [Proteobacteria bacterium]|nr:50S ribosome-binding GTPase [Pseudomonadota bacterium]